MSSYVIGFLNEFLYVMSYLNEFLREHFGLSAEIRHTL
jgi:hypothetical protein